MRRRWGLHPAALAALALCAALAAPAAANADTLAERLDRIFAAEGLAGAEVGVAVIDLDGGSVLYERDADRPLSLASNTKLFTTAAALDRLGPGYRFETTVLRRGPIVADALEGDLIVRGGGDPCLGARFDGRADGALRRLARAVREAGVRRVAGDLVADDGFLDREHQHPGWPQDQLDRWYAAPVGALALNDGCVDVTVSPGPRPGAPAVVALDPPCPLFEVEARCRTTADRKEHVVDVGRRPGANRIVVRGAILAGSEPVTTSLAVVDPALVFAAVLRECLRAEGVEVAGAVRLVSAEDRLAGVVPLAVHASLLAQALPVVNKRSQNHYAEQVLKVLGAVKGGAGTWAAGLAVEAEFLEEAKIAPKGAATLVDGSGLARANRAPARAVARLLAHMARHEHASAWLASLAVPGRDGTLRARLDGGGGLGGRVIAKTGTIRGVSVLSGYVLRESGSGAPPAIAFSILLNSLKHGPAHARAAQDAAVEAIAAEADARAAAPAGAAAGG